jgi:hypothetical protein
VLPPTPPPADNRRSMIYSEGSIGEREAELLPYEKCRAEVCGELLLYELAPAVTGDWFFRVVHRLKLDQGFYDYAMSASSYVEAGPVWNRKGRMAHLRRLVKSPESGLDALERQVVLSFATLEDN